MSVQSLREWKSRVSKWRGWAVAPSGTKGPNFWINLAFENVYALYLLLHHRQFTNVQKADLRKRCNGWWQVVGPVWVGGSTAGGGKAWAAVAGAEQTVAATWWNTLKLSTKLKRSGFSVIRCCSLHSTTVIAQTLWKREQSSDRRNRFMLSHCTLFIKSSCHDDMTWEKSM